MGVDVNDLLKLLVEKKASDLYIKVARPPILRIAGILTPQEEFEPFNPDDTESLIYQMMNEVQLMKFEENMDLDFSYSLHGVSRFRVNSFRQRGVVGAVIRCVPYDIPTIEQLALPSVLKDLTAKPVGLILVTGPTGSGKSTTLAAMVGYINSLRNCHIITIEDPIEYLHKDDKAVIDQREVEIDTKTFKTALKAAMREDPEVLLMGEMRDLETISTAITAAETGHMVFSTLHTNDAPQTIDRILDVFPIDQQAQVRIQIASVLTAIISQRLLKRADDTGRIAAVEVMINSPFIKELIEKGHISQIHNTISASATYWRMQTLNQSIASLVKYKVVTIEEGLFNTPYPDELKLMIKGTFATET